MTQIKFIVLIFMLIPFTGMGQVEICDNGIDDDLDGFLDLNDDDCICEIIEPKSLISNPSFEDMDCCPDDRSQLDCASNWIQASEPTTDFIHTCDWLGWDDFIPPQPFPDGQGIMGFRDGRVRNNNNNEPEPYWKEYAGACLISPLLADSSYRFQFDVGFVDPQKSPPIEISFFGTTDCNFLPFGVGNEAFGCPTNDPNWIKLGEVFVSGASGNIWVNTFIEIVPEQDIYAIAIGPDCNPISSPISIYYFFDNLLLSNLEFFDLKFTEESHPCDEAFTLSVPFNSNFAYQWYLSGVALVGETFSELTQNYGEGSYQVRILNGETCRVSANYDYVIPTYDAPAIVSICEGDSYPFGDLQLTQAGMYLDTFKTLNNCDSIVALELEVIGAEYDTLEASIFNGETYTIEDYSFDEAGDYPLALSSEFGCDKMVLLRLSSFDIFIPNAFSPNRDGINDVFKPFASSGKIESIDMLIFDRWGNLIHQGSEWDGGNLQQDVFVYVVEIFFTHGTMQPFQGSVTLVK